MAVKQLCRVLEVSRSGYYVARKRLASSPVEQAWASRQHESQRKLLGQFGHGALLPEPEDGVRLAS